MVFPDWSKFQTIFHLIILVSVSCILYTKRDNHYTVHDMTMLPPDLFHPPPPSDMVRVGPFLQLPGLLREFGVTPDQVLKQFGFCESTFADPENTIPASVRGPILAACARESGCAHFGLLLGGRNNASALGIIGFLMRNAPDVQTALSDLAANLHLHNRVAAPYLEISGRQALFGYQTLLPYAEGWEQIDDGAMALLLNIMRTMCGSGWLPGEVRFRRSKPDNIDAYRRYFGAPLLFGAERTALIFSSSWLSEKVQFADSSLRIHFEQQVRVMKSFSREDFVVQVEQLLVRQLGTKHCSLHGLASQLGLHPRTLNRRLQGAGTSYRELHKTARHQLARKLLCDTASSVPAIATMLGYSGSNAFVRAFGQWESVPPATWRKRVCRAAPVEHTKEP